MTFELSWRSLFISFQNLIKDQSIFPLVIILLIMILITFSWLCMRIDVVRRILMLIPLGTWRVNGHLDVVAAIPWLSVYTKFIFAENGNLSLPVLSTIRVRKIRRKGPILSYLYCGVLLHNVVLDRWLDFQSLQLTEEPPEDEEEDPFTAKLMSFEVRLQLLKSRRVLSVEAVLLLCCFQTLYGWYWSLWGYE